MRWLLLSALIGCGASNRAPLERAQLGTPAARQVGSFHTEGGHRELTPHNIEESELDDEATLVTDRCVDVVLRDDMDAKVELYTPVLVVDGVKVQPTIENEQARLVVLPKGKGKKADECELGIGAEVPAFCVFVRTARLCAPAAGHTIELQLVHPTLVYRSELVDRKTRFALSFAWTIR